MLSVTVQVTGLDNVESRLTALGAKLYDFTAAFESLATQLILFYSQTVFGSRGQALGEDWQPLTAKTDQEKASKWPGKDMLVRTGTMQDSFYSEVTPVSLFIGNKVDYFPYHQLGTSPGAGRGHNIPARQMLGINDTVEGMIRETIEADIREKINSTGA